MKSLADLPDVIPLFPLPSALVLPRSHLPLHIFEPRYLTMVEDCMKTPQRLIGMVQPGTQDMPLGLHQVGCAGRLTQFSETDDGRYMITLTGVCRFRLGAEVDGFAAYRRVEPDWSDFEADLKGPHKDETLDRARFLPLLSRYFDSKGLETDWKLLKDADDELLINSLAMLLTFPVEDKQALLEAKTLGQRRETLETLIEFALLAGGDETNGALQ